MSAESMVPVHTVDGHKVFMPADRASMRIDAAWLESESACSEGLNWFNAQFPDGCSYATLRAALHRNDWESWLCLHVGGDTATAGDGGTATAGYRGTATAGDGGFIAIRYFDQETQCCRVRIGTIGEAGLLPRVAYKLNDNAQFVRAEDSNQ